jgi:hypothetical protein
MRFRILILLFRSRVMLCTSVLHETQTQERTQYRHRNAWAESNTNDDIMAALRLAPFRWFRYGGWGWG